MPSKKDAILWSLGATTGLSVAAWRLLFPWIGYDIQLLKVISKGGKAMIEYLNSNRHFIDNFEDQVRKQPKKTAIIFEGRYYSYELVNQQACKVADIVSSWGLGREDSVAIFVQNSPEFVWILLGLMKLGVIATLPNINSKGETLKNCITVTDTKAVIVGHDDYLIEAVDAIREDINVRLYMLGPNVRDGYQSWDQLMLMASPADVCRSQRGHIDTFSTVAYAFTSGTTGLPKAVRIPAGKINIFSTFLSNFSPTVDDVIYDVLPLYHMIGLAAVLASLNTGCSVVIRKKFSASHFFKDCQTYNVTIFFYIGELCRYLLALPEGPDDKNHKIRGITGNGLRKDIWKRFRERFNIPFILEFFGATEGTSAMANVADRPGAVGRISPLMVCNDTLQVIS